MRRIKTYPWYTGSIVKQPFYAIKIPRERDADPEDVAVSRIIINKLGVPISCEVIHRAKSANLNLAACHNFANSRFDPAIDTSGNPMSAPVFSETAWPNPD